MTRTFYLPGGNAPLSQTMTVGELIQILRAFAPNTPVVFQSPKHGVFGPRTHYPIEDARRVNLPRKETYHPETSYTDEETGARVTISAWTLIQNAWSGVVIS